MLAAPRRSEFQEFRPEVARDILDRALYGHLAAVSPQGLPQTWPLNHVLLDDAIYFHGSPRNGASGCVGRPVVFAAEDSVAWIPSTWRHAQAAGGASTFYRSVQVHGNLERVTSPDEKAAVLEAFMQRYQPEGGYRPLAEESHRLGGVEVLRLPFQEWSCRVKMGQHLPQEQRRVVRTELLRRGRPGDRVAAARMGQVDPGLVGETGWTDDPGRVPLEQLHALLAGTWWAAARPLHVVRQHLWESDLTMASLEDGRLLAYARVVSTGRGVAWIFDVVVHPEERGRGRGSELMGRLLEHPRLESVSRLFLDTRDAMELYRRFGFIELIRTSRSGGSTLMLRELPQGPTAPV